MDAADPVPEGPPQERFAGRVLRVVQETVRFPDGRRVRFDLVRHPGAVAVLPLLTQPLQVVLVHQYRHAVGRRIWEVPAGTRDRPGEPAIECARRELAEEAGYRARRIAPVCEFYPAPGFCDERMGLFAAWGLEPVPAPERPEEDLDELMEVHATPWERVREMVRSGEIEDAKTLVAVRWLESVLRGA